LKGRHFGTLDNIQKSVTDELKGIPSEALHHCYEQCKQRLRRCVAAQGNYSEGDNLDLQIQIKFIVKRKSVSLLFCHTVYVIFSAIMQRINYMFRPLLVMAETCS